MKLYFFILGLLFSLTSHFVSGQALVGVHGKITDQNGKPLPFAGINVKGTSLGTLANEDGRYELVLAAGSHILHFQHLGFKTIEREVSVGNTPIDLDIKLSEQPLVLHELKVGKDTEDPAYAIMRRAIAKARYHQLQIRSYSASVYARSTALPTKIPLLMRRRMQKQGIRENVAFVNESVSKVDFTRPNSYKQRIVSTRNNLDNSTPTPNEFIFASFYDPEVGGTVTPLSPKALSIYKFEYEGHFEDRGEVVNKIKVTPKSFKQGVFRGSIYILDNRWAIHSFNLETIWQGFNINVKQLYAPTQDVWIPSSQHFDIKGSYLGFAGKFSYVVSIQYEKLRVDPVLKESVSITDAGQAAQPPARPGNKALEQSLQNYVSSGEKTDAREFKKMVRRYENEQRKTENPGQSPREMRRDSIVVEPLANRRDSAYWNTVRGVPLTRTEVVSYQVGDSIVAVRKQKAAPADTTRFKPLHLLTGGRYRYGGGRSLSLSSPLRSLAFNPTEAFNFDINVEWQSRFSRERSLRISPVVHYSTGRNRFSPTLALQYSGQTQSFSLSGGEEIRQVNGQNPIHPLVNSFYYLLLNRNHMRVYQSRFIEAAYRKKELFEIADLDVRLETGRRYWLNNLEKRGRFLRGEPLSRENQNIPDYADYPSFYFSPNTRYTVLTLQLDVRPWQQFSVRNGKKRYSGPRSPVFTVVYKKGLPVFGSDVDYDLLEGSVRYEPKVFAASTLQMQLNGGRFLNNKSMALPDMKHFMGNRTLLQLGDHLTGFRLLPYYQFSTAQNYVQGHASFRSPKLLLTQLPLLRMLGIKEYVQGHMLHTPNTYFYTEQVYGIEGLLKVIRLEFATHFDQDLYLGSGFRIGTLFNF
ncbi:hypothetical protein GCM10023091_10310 [Ravibacter arvi]|uniref:Carboxypeptidase-like protein n=1 Tax=Ravibacter arvi TaxID=2051041 RepID=A0ABP8LSV9_9BACT